MINFDFAPPLVIYLFYNILTFTTIVAVFKKKDFLIRNERLVLFSAALFFIYSQFIRYGLGAINGTFSFKEDLPFYVCRVSSLIFFLYLTTRHPRLHNALYFIAATSIIGVLVPSGPLENIPTLHETYFIDHYILSVLPFFLLVTRDFRPDVRKAFIYALLFLAVFIVAIPLNRLYGTDYFHLESQNIATDIIPGMHPLVFAFAFAAAMALFFALYAKIATVYHDTQAQRTKTRETFSP